MSEPPHVLGTERDSASPLLTRAVWGILVVVVLGISVAFMAKWFRDTQLQLHRKLPVHVQIPEFEFTERSGRPFGSKDLRGKVWIADFVFTRCGGPCPLMSAHMSELQNTFRNVPDLKLVSFSVDPRYDSPEVLRRYADLFHADPDQWLFLTGQEEDIHKLARGSFKETVMKGDRNQAEPDAAILHSVHFVLVDRQGRIRGWYDSTDRNTQPRLVSDALVLMGEKTP